MSFTPVVQPYQLATFEAFAFSLWDGDPNVPATAGYTPFGRAAYAHLRFNTYGFTRNMGKSFQGFRECAGRHSADEMVGIVSGEIPWASLLSQSVPDFIRGLDAVITVTLADSEEAFTYRFQDENFKFVGLGDLHDESYDYKRVSANVEINMATLIPESASHVISFYLTDVFYDEYRTNGPVYFAVGGTALILFYSILFLLYDRSVSTESREQRVVLDIKRQFVRFISHEICTPLNSVHLGLKLFDVKLVAGVKALATASPAEALLMVGEIMQNWIQLTDNCLSNTEAAEDVLSDLLNYDKIESGTLRLKFPSVWLWDVVKKVTAGFVLQAKEKGVLLELKGRLWEEDVTAEKKDDFASLHVVGDAGRISQILRNIVSNAIKFTPELGTVILQGMDTIYADAELLDNPRAGSVRVSITDTGADLSQEQLAQICGEGVQFNANLLQAGQGSGLDLFISKGITEQHGGTLTVTSAGLDCGSTFAHDATLNRKLLMRILKLKGFLCKESENGLLSFQKFDPVRTDYELPVMDSPTSVRKMRELGCTCFIVGITGNVLQEQIDFFKEHGANTVLAKPLDTDVFESVYERWMNAKKPRSMGRKQSALSSPRSQTGELKPMRILKEEDFFIFQDAV
ncbi:hypothetical protein B484DRAFT_393251 [Ochromonadaceae sp. CCMP2298]|nr:hypothetical protein B484DRAFT_393251 [Ochromonadaceae sp. CCMP2298]